MHLHSSRPTPSSCKTCFFKKGIHMASLPLSGACKDAGEPWLMCLEVSFPRKRSEFGAKEVGGARSWILPPGRMAI